MDIKIERYNSSLQSVWDSFVKDAKNGVFLFERNYLEYHADRFTDHSLLFYKEDELVCVLPANEKETTYSSHGGLTFGGFIMSRRASITFVNKAFPVLLDYLKQNSFTTFIYKSIPFVYHQLPAQEDLYTLFLNGANLYRRDASSVIDLSGKISYGKGTKASLSKARKNELVVKESLDFKTFMDIEEQILRVKYNTRPTHTCEEITLLAERFPNNIKLYLVYKGDNCVGGTILYISDLVVHTQYIGITDEGKEIGALDFLTDALIQIYRPNKKYYSFGISTENDGRYLNEGLVRNKESFGARTVTHDFYRIELS
ncbi:GNAT family N-acetyltransferase [Pinibacter soli]|uniref:GNAT family N-acetyltransferase n=1 Tax=Pinibacter soli TaxID=3044211 RepID=A0ABT6R7U5_9BACT|nr:GNAT family N-acetyltransferase [Pinibacter soli]MDI3318638.1 GNAT family N-acetyltransferase [Pinibacter soli]